MSKLNAELEALMASAEDTHKLDTVDVVIYDRDTGTVAKKLNIHVRGATFFELARFFKKYPEVLKLLTGGVGDEVAEDATDAEKKAATKANTEKFMNFILDIPEAMAAFNSIFVSKPFDPATMESFAVMSNEANEPILERGLHKTFEGDIQGFFGRKGKMLGKAIGLKNQEISAQTSSPSTPTKSQKTKEAS